MNTLDKTFVTGHSFVKSHDLTTNGVLVEGIFATNDRDYQGDIIESSFLRDVASGLSNNAPVYLNHFYHQPAIGKVIKAEYHEDSDTGRAWVQGSVLIDSDNHELRRQVKDGRLKYFSVGGHLEDYDIEKGADGRETRHCRSGKVLELSVTPVPINLSAGMTLAKAQDSQKLAHNLAFVKGVLAAQVDQNEDALTKLVDTYGYYENIEFVPSKEQNTMTNLFKGSGDVPKFKKLDEKPSKDEIGFGHGTKFSEDDTEKYFKPNLGSFGSKNVDELNTPDKHSMEFLTKHKSQMVSSEDKDDFGFIDEASKKFIGRYSAPQKTAPNSYDDSNSVDENSNAWIDSQAKTFVEGLGNEQKGILMKSLLSSLTTSGKAVVIDELLHDFSSDSLFQENYESNPQAMHRFIHQMHKAAKGSKLREILEDNVINLIKGVDMSSLSSNLYDKAIFDHIVSPDHLLETHSLFEAAGWFKKAGMPGEEEQGSAPMPQQGAPMPSESPAGPQAEAGASSPVGDESLGDEQMSALSDVIAQTAGSLGIQPQSSDPIEAAMEIMQMLQSSDDPAAQQALAQFQQQVSQIINGGADSGGQDMQQGGMPPQQSSPQGGLGFGKSALSHAGQQQANENYERNAVRDAFDRARQEQIIKSRVVPPAINPSMSHSNGAPVSANELLIADWANQFITG